MERKLIKTFDDWEEEDNVNEPKIKELSAENKKLREEITKINISEKHKEYESIKVQSNIFNSKKRVKDNEIRKSMFDVRAQNIPSKRDILAEYETLEKEVK